MKYSYEFYGGPLNMAKFDKLDAELFCDGVTEDLSAIRNAGGLVHRAELDNQPTFHGYLGPMWDGMRMLGTDGLWHYEHDHFTPAVPEQKCAVLRYESPEVYDMLSR